MRLKSDEPEVEKFRKEQAADEDLDEFETPALMPTFVDRMLGEREQGTKGPRDPLERQQAKEKIDFTA